MMRTSTAPHEHVIQTRSPSTPPLMPKLIGVPPL